MRPEDVAALLDERAVLAALAEYAHALDGHDVDRWVATFTSDGLFEVRYDGRTVHREAGHAELRRWATAAPPGGSRRHLLADPLVTLDGDDAHVTSCWTLLERGPDGRPVVGAFGRYDDRLVKRDGVWRFASRLADIEATTRDLGPG